MSGGSRRGGSRRDGTGPRGVVRGRVVRRRVWAVIAALSLAGCGAAAPAPRPAVRAGSPGTTVFPVATRAEVPDVSGRTLEGQPFALRELAGSGVVVINVWASWCTSCREESAALAAVAQETRDRPVRFVGIDEQDSPSSAREFLAGTGTTYPQVADPEGDVLRALSLLPNTGIPSTLLLDPSGRMAARVIGPVTRPELRRLILILQSAT